MLEQHIGNKTLILLAVTLKGKNGDAIIQSELLQLSGRDAIRLPRDRHARRSTLTELKNLSPTTATVLVHKIDHLKYEAKEMLRHLNWTDEPLNAMLETQTGCELLCDWFITAKDDRHYYQAGEEASYPKVPDDLALKAALKYVSIGKAGIYDMHNRIEEVLNKFIDKIDLVEMSKNVYSREPVFNLAIKHRSLHLTQILQNAYEAAEKAQCLPALRDIACVNFMPRISNTDLALPKEQRNKVVAEHLQIIQKILEKPEMIKEMKLNEEDSAIDYGYILSTIHCNYGVGFKLILQDVK